MLRRFYFLIPVLALGLVTACNDDDNGGDPPETNNCPPGTNFCMTYQGEVKSGTAELELPPGNEPETGIMWENAENSLEQVDMDIYGQAPGDYVVDTTRATGTVYFEYFNADENKTFLGVGGTVNITTFDIQPVEPTDPTVSEAGLTGSFEVTLDDGSVITDGHFIRVNES